MLSRKEQAASLEASMRGNFEARERALGEGAEAAAAQRAGLEALKEDVAARTEQVAMSHTYEPSSEPLHISVK